MIEIGLFYLELKTKSKILQEIINDVRAKHRYLCVETRLKLKELQKPFLGLRMAFINPKVKNRTYKVKGLELKHLSVKLDFVKMQTDMIIQKLKKKNLKQE